MTWSISGDHSGSQRSGILAPNLQQIPRPNKALFSGRFPVDMSKLAAAPGGAINFDSESRLLKQYIQGRILKQ